MMTLSGVKLKITTYPDNVALQSFYSYTLPNTPFYFKVQWLTNDEAYKAKFSNHQIVWDFGDGTYSTGGETEHYYKWPGVYQVNATIYDTDGITHIVEGDSKLFVYNAVPDLVTFGVLNQQASIYPLMAGKKSPPLKIYRYNSWQYDHDLNGQNYTVNFYVSGSNSNYVSVSSYYTNSWSHLKAYFGFIQQNVNVSNILEDRVIDSSETTSTKIYAERINTGLFNNNWGIKLGYYGYAKEGTVFCGTSGILPEDKKVYFTDQKPSGNGIDSFNVVYASTDTKIYKDENYLKYGLKIDEPYGIVNYPYQALFFKSIFNPATGIKITSNGISVEGPIEEGKDGLQRNYSFDIYPIKYTGSNINFVCTLKDTENYTTKCYDKLNLINEGNLNLNDVKLSLVEFLSSDTIEEVKQASFSLNSDVPDYKNSGSYLPGILNIDREVAVAAISATALIIDRSVPLASDGTGFIMQPGLNLFRKVNSVVKYGYYEGQDKFRVGVTSILDTINANVSGGVNITYAPLFLNNPLSGAYVWVTNSSNDSLLLFDNNGNQLLNTVFFRRLRFLRTTPEGRTTLTQVNALGENKSASPCNVAIDSEGSAWVTLRDSVSTFKIDKNTLIATKMIVPNVTNMQYYSRGDYLSLSGFAGEDSVLPSSIDVDREDNVYISYTNTLCSFIGKYDKNGNEIQKIPFIFPNTVKQILVDAENNLWVSTFNNNPVINSSGPAQTSNITDRTDFLFYINQQSPSNNFLKPFSFIGDLTMDSGGNVWVSSKNNTLSKVTKDGVVSSFIMGNPESATDYVPDFGGIAGDLNGNIWVINNSEGILQFFDSTNPRQLKPRQYSYAILPGISETNSLEGSLSYYLTLGDFTGIRWALKNKITETTAPRIVTGLSNYFSIKRPSNVIVKKNENYDLGATIKGYALQESLFNSNNLFDNFFTPILNGAPASLDELGKVVYERISNFVDNNADIDKCNINALKSLYNLVGEDLPDFAFSLPPKIKRVIDLLSVKKCLLQGNFNTFNREFVLSSFDFNPQSNLGEEINVETGHFEPGLPIVTYELFSKKYSLILNTLIQENDAKHLMSYPLSGVKYDWGWGLVLANKNQNYKDIKNYYKFYKFKPNTHNELYDGLIDFNSDLTTLLKGRYTINDWTSFGGIMDDMIGSAIYNNMK